MSGEERREAVPTGYKMTEVGLIPEDWGLRNLKSICDVRDGTHESPTFHESGVPLVTSKNIIDGRLDLKHVGLISETDASEINNRSEVHQNDILMSMIGTIGNAVLVDFKPEFCIKNVALFKPRSIDPEFLIQMIRSPIFQALLDESMDGGIQKFVSLGTLRDLRILSPPLPEQRAIAEALSDVDNLLDALDRLIAKKRAVKQAVMQQLLTGKNRLPGFAGEWEETTLGGILTVRHGKNQRTIEAVGGEYPILATGGEIGRTDVAMYDQPSVLIGRKGTIDRPRYMETPFWTVDTLYYTEIGGGHSAKYIYYLFFRIPWRDHNEASGVPSLSSSTIEKIIVRVPPLPEQRAIAEVLSDMDDEITALEKRRDKTRRIKEGMMQQLLTGRVRLVPAADPPSED